jgi:hypothetical protein
MRPLAQASEIKGASCLYYLKLRAFAITDFSMHHPEISPNGLGWRLQSIRTRSNMSASSFLGITSIITTAICKQFFLVPMNWVIGVTSVVVSTETRQVGVSQEVALESTPAEPVMKAAHDPI